MVSVCVAFGLLASALISIVFFDCGAPVTALLMIVRYDVDGEAVIATAAPGADPGAIDRSTILSFRHTGEIVIPVPLSVSRCLKSPVCTITSPVTLLMPFATI